MKVKHIIKMLQEQNPEAEVVIKAMILDGNNDYSTDRGELSIFPSLIEKNTVFVDITGRLAGFQN